MQENRWIETLSESQSFCLDGEPIAIHVIKNGHGKYMVVYDDAYELETGRVEIGTKEFIEEKFCIKLK